MAQHYSQAFKKQAVKKVLLRAPNVTIQAIASELGVSCSTMYDWISRIERNAEGKTMAKEKKPTDRSLEERFDMIISCGSITAKPTLKQRFDILTSILAIGPTTAFALITEMPELGNMSAKQVSSFIATGPS